NSGLWIKNWMEHQRRDAVWKHGSVCENYADIQCAVYAVGGWLDAYTNAIPRLLQHLTCPKKAMIGQWGHRFTPIAQPRPPVGGALVFETAPLEDTVEVLGAPVVELELSADKPQALVCVRLSDVQPSGAATRVSYGLLNLTHRDSHEHPEPLAPGKTYKVKVK